MPPTVPTYSAPAPPTKQARWLTLWQFARPHTIIGTTLSVLALFVLAIATLLPRPISKLPWEQLVGTLMACLLGNVYIVGLNQLEDIEIDRINKPQLPLASGELSLLQGRQIVGGAGILSLLLAGTMGWGLLATVALSLGIGTAYSLPPFRLKRFPLFAAFCILTVRGAVINLGIFGHFSQVLTNQAQFPPVIWLLTGFVLLFSIAIAIFKDVPDQEGDQAYQIQTFSLILGKKIIFRISVSIIAFCYLMVMMVAAFGQLAVNPWLMIGGHGGLLLILLLRSRGVDLENKEQIARFYQFIWKLFFLEYLLFPLFCLARSS
jgi:homogentisate phytyltransferase/homogentisate geranylgeranyltransferase